MRTAGCSGRGTASAALTGLQLLWAGGDIGAGCTQLGSSGLCLACPGCPSCRALLSEFNQQALFSRLNSANRTCRLNPTVPALCSGSVKPGVAQLPPLSCPPNYYASMADADIVLGRKLVDAYFIQARPLLRHSSLTHLHTLQPRNPALPARAPRGVPGRALRLQPPDAGCWQLGTGFWPKAHTTPGAPVYPHVPPTRRWAGLSC